ncbi:MAG: aminodeoxychorismate/anthranilate synthase component II [Haloferacaceae archaeon]
MTGAPTILVIDNYDSFVYNLVQYVGAVLDDLGHDAREAVTVRRNDAVGIGEIRDLDPDGVVVSPGPGTPADAGVSVPIFADLAVPTLGVCLGHQALCAAHGMTVGGAPRVVHGKPSRVIHDGDGVFDGLPEVLRVGRYHSLAARGEVPSALDVTARTADDRGVVMGVRHAEKPHVGVQFHPESVLTEAGMDLVENFCRACV